VIQVKTSEDKVRQSERDKVRTMKTKETSEDKGRQERQVNTRETSEFKRDK
jgi:hypothetical protein